MTELEKRFWSKVRKGQMCWEWVAAKCGAGYGEFWLEGRMVGAHRVSYEMEFGQIPNNLQVCHTCDNPVCVKPNHLFLGTQKDNMQDAVKKGRRPSRLACLSAARGSNHGHSKLNEIEVELIRKDQRLHREIAKEYGVTRRTISDVKKYKTWKHVSRLA